MGFRSWWQKLNEPPPTNRVVNGVTMPPIDDPRWEVYETKPMTVRLRGHDIEAYRGEGDYGEDWSSLWVDGMRWIGDDARSYARAVVTSTLASYEARQLERSREVARRATAGDAPAKEPDVGELKAQVALLEDAVDAQGNVTFSSLVDEVAQAMVNEDLPQFGRAWPWPSGDDWEIRAREEARELARVAIRATVKWLRS